MKREWKPGDVALARWQHFEAAPALWLSSRRCWIDSDGAEFDGDEDDLTLRPLVVIDPEDREQVERLLIDHLTRYDGTDAVPQDDEIACMQAALRSLVAPSKPDEPQGLGAVVLDDQGRRWVRDRRSDCDPWCNDDPGFRRWSMYASIDAVRVLSEGVTPDGAR